MARRRVLRPLSQLKTYSLAARPSKVRMEAFARPLPAGSSVAQFLDALPRILAVEEFRTLVDAIVRAYRRGRPVLALLPWELYESLVETLEVLGDQDLMKALRRSLTEARAGRTIPWEKVKGELDL